MAPYDVDNDPYIDPETDILNNLLGIQTETELKSAEARLTAVEIVALTTEDVPHHYKFTKDLFFDVHRQIFKDLYPWAGKIRTVELSKGGTSFARARFINHNLDDIFEDLKKNNYLVNRDFVEFADSIAHYYCELIIVHPFRDGNGRAIRTFLAMLSDSVGWHIAWDRMNPAENIAASISAYNGDEVPMRLLLQNIVAPNDPYEIL